MYVRLILYLVYNISIMLATTLISFYMSSSFIWIVIELFILIGLFFLIKKPNNGGAILLELMYEKVYDFFVEILWTAEKAWVKTYITALFFIILLSNLLWIFLEILAPIFWVNGKWEFILEHYISIPSGDINFNLALSIVSIFVILYIQFSHLWIKHFLYDYFPIYWKGYLTIERWDKSALVYYPLFIFAKIFDIFISLFLWMLEIIWLLAKIISLSFRLFWNMASWTILLAMAVIWICSMTTDIFGFNFPVWLPVLIYLQEILVAFIQALVFPLLVSIFIKVATVESEA